MLLPSVHVGCIAARCGSAAPGEDLGRQLLHSPAVRQPVPVSHWHRQTQVCTCTPYNSGSRLRAYYFSIVALRAIQMEFSIARQKC